MSEIGIPPVQTRSGPQIRAGLSIGDNPVMEALMHRGPTSPFFITAPHNHKMPNYGNSGFGQVELKDSFRDRYRNTSDESSGIRRVNQSRGIRAGVFIDTASDQITDDTLMDTAPVTSFKRNKNDDRSVSETATTTIRTGYQSEHNRRGIEAGIALNKRTVTATLLGSAIATLIGNTTSTLDGLPLPQFVIGGWTVDTGRSIEERAIPESEQLFITELTSVQPPRIVEKVSRTEGNPITTPFDTTITVDMGWAKDFSADPNIAKIDNSDELSDLISSVSDVDDLQIELRGFSDAADDGEFSLGGVTTLNSKNIEVVEAREDAVEAVILANNPNAQITRPNDYQAEDVFSQSRVETMITLAEKYDLTPQELVERYHRGELDGIPEIAVWGQENFDTYQSVEVTASGTVTEIPTISTIEEVCETIEWTTEVPIRTEEEVIVQESVTVPSLSVFALPFLFYAARRQRRYVKFDQKRIRTNKTISVSPSKSPPIPPGPKQTPPPTIKTPTENTAPTQPKTKPEQRPESKRRGCLVPLAGLGLVALAMLAVTLDSCDPDTPKTPTAVPNTTPASVPAVESCEKITYFTDREGKVSQSSSTVTVQSNDIAND